MKRFICCLMLVMMRVTLIQAQTYNLPQHATNLDIPVIPPSVIDTYCNPTAPFEHLLLIRAAIRVDKPVYRIVAIKREQYQKVTAVKLFQFLTV